MNIVLFIFAMLGLSAAATQPEAEYTTLRELLARYEEILTTYDGDHRKAGAVTIIITGERPRATIAAESHRLAAIDGSMIDLDSDASTELVPWVSTKWDD